MRTDDRIFMDALIRNLWLNVETKTYSSSHHFTVAYTNNRMPISTTQCSTNSVRCILVKSSRTDQAILSVIKTKVKPIRYEYITCLITATKMKFKWHQYDVRKALLNVRLIRKTIPDHSFSNRKNSLVCVCVCVCVCVVGQGALDYTELLG